MATLVMKFGGSLTADAKGITRVAQVILAETLAWKRMIVVMSAMAGATDALTHAAELAASRKAAESRRVIGALRDEHVAVIDALIAESALRRDLTNAIDGLLFDVLTTCDAILDRREATSRDRDVIMAAGERMITHILAALVRQEGLRAVMVDAASLIVTDDHHQNATPILDLIDERVERLLRPLIDDGIVPIVTGFIGATRNGIVTTLGRGGSDYTATILAASLHADEVWVWTNVDGIMSADPQLVPGARVIPSLSYEELGELSYFGANVIHPRAVEPLLPQGIQLRVRNPFNLDHAGTLIQAENDDSTVGLKAVTAADGVCLTTVGRSIDVMEFLGEVRRIVGQMAVGPVIVMQSHRRSTLVFVIPTTVGPKAVSTVTQRLSAGLGVERWEVVPVKVIAVMGSPALSPVFESQVAGSVRPLATVVGPGDRRLIAVAPQDVQAVVRQFHKLTSQSVYG